MHLLTTITTAAVEYQGFWASFGDLLWWILCVILLGTYLVVLFAIVNDLFRDHTLNGWFKALWIVFLLVLPILTAMVYLVARGTGMGQRARAEAQQVHDAQAAYVSSLVGPGASSPSDEIAKAKALFDAGTITAAEYESLKAKALA